MADDDADDFINQLNSNSGANKPAAPAGPTS